MYWASRLIGLALEFGVFVALGWWLDRQFGTRPVLVLVGMVLGMAAAGWHLALIAREAGKIKPPRLKNPLPPPPEDDPGDEDWPSPRRSKRD
jgi:F0F1-type ATP synthase assembly protein I